MIITNKLDPRTKILIVLCLSSLGVFIRKIDMLAFVLFISLIIALLLKSNLFSIIKKLKKVLYLIIFIAIIQSIFTPTGKPIINIGNFSLLTLEGLEKGIQFVLRMGVIIVSATILATSNSRDIVQGLIQWKIPYEISFMVSVGIRFLPMLTEEIKDSVNAIQLRGIELEKIPFKRKLKMYSYIFTPIVSSSILKAQNLSVAMEARAFRAFPQRTSYRVLKMTFIDYAIIIFSLCIAIIIFTLVYK